MPASQVHVALLSSTVVLGGCLGALDDPGDHYSFTTTHFVLAGICL